jgi:hypothetical protein
METIASFLLANLRFIHLSKLNRENNSVFGEHVTVVKLVRKL